MFSWLNSKVYFFSEGAKSNIRNRKKLKAFIISIFKSEKRELDTINYIFSTDKNVQKINQNYLNHYSLTDIITFEFNELGQPTLADVYVNLERVKENALQLGTSFKSELHRVIFHGALHLCGYTDKTKFQKKTMRKQEDFYLLKYFH